jgi:hypothetical protein
MRSELAVHGSLSRGTFAVVVLLSLAVLLAPGPAVPAAPYGLDKVVHAGLFAALAVSGRWAGVRRGVLATLLPLYAAVSELLQELPALQRDASLGDLLADVAGVLAGLLVWGAASRRRPRAGG